MTRMLSSGVFDVGPIVGCGRAAPRPNWRNFGSRNCRRTGWIAPERSSITVLAGGRAMSDTNAPDVRKIDRTELASGLLLILVAAAFAATALRNRSLGTAGSMGPGSFPLLVTMPLALIGLIVTARAFGRRNAPQETVRPIALV